MPLILMQLLFSESHESKASCCEVLEVPTVGLPEGRVGY